jgi:selenocysteine lyase/cysteine desulfurase
MNNTTIASSTGLTIPRDEFPVLKHGFYANHAAISPWPRVTARAVAAFAEENCNQGSAAYKYWLQRESRLRQRLASLLNAASPGDIALLKNTTEGISTVAGGIAWSNGDNVVIPKDEFPSNRLPWLALQRVGVEVREVDIRCADDPEQALVSQMDERTRLLSVSSVQWVDGLRLRLETLGEACRQNGVRFFVDAIQHLGALQIDVEACNIDFLAADGHKWLLAPEGIAVFYCREAAREELQLSQHGWHMVDEPYQFDRQQWQPSATATRFEAGSPNTLGQVALHASVSLLQQVGMVNVEACVSANTRALVAGIESIPGLEPVRPFDPQRVSGIVSLKPLNTDLSRFFQALTARQLSCTIRGGAIRLSPHFYQCGEPIAEMLNILNDVVMNNSD